MRSFALATSCIALILAVAGCNQETPPDNTGAVGTWGSDQASLTVTDTSAALLILAGNCYGSRVDAARTVSADTFDVAATYTRFTGVAPGYITQAVQLSGHGAGNQLTVTVVAPGSGDVIAGPFPLTFRVTQNWSQCLYP